MRSRTPTTHYRKSRGRRRSHAARLTSFRELTYRQISAESGVSKATIGFAFEGTVRLDPAILKALFDLTGDAAFVAEVQEASRQAWIEQHPDADPTTHLKIGEVPS